MASQGARCLGTWEQVARALGHPRSILCLGNGPSSEDPALAGAAFDCVFRVNWIWRDRALFTAPRAVFTADPDVPHVTDLLVAFPTRADAKRVLTLYRAARRLPRGGYCVMEDLPSPLTKQTWSFRPTNGALMIAAAVALKPERLTIAGIDLYRHPAGKYPGETAEANAYDAIHSRETDLAAIGLALDAHRGTLAVFGPLREALGPAGCKA